MQPKNEIRLSDFSHALQQPRGYLDVADTGVYKARTLHVPYGFVSCYSVRSIYDLLPQCGTRDFFVKVTPRALHSCHLFSSLSNPVRTFASCANSVCGKLSGGYADTSLYLQSTTRTMSSAQRDRLWHALRNKLLFASQILLQFMISPSFAKEILN